MGPAFHPVRLPVLLLMNLLFALLVPGAIAGWVPWHFFARRPDWPARPWAWPHAPGMALMAAGLALLAHCLWLFAAYGRGTPAPIAPPVKLVQRGAYRWVRNPMYLAVLATVGGEALFFASVDIAVYWVGLACCFQLFVVLYEEEVLSRDFGAMYEDYRREVPRWWPAAPRSRR